MKKTLTAITLAVVLMFGATFANAGIIVIGKADTTCTSTDKNGIIVIGKNGIIVIGSAIATAITGIIVIGSADPAPCVEKDGIIVIG